MAGILADAPGQVSLIWGGDTGALEPIPARALWAGPAGTLLGQAYPASVPDFLTAPQGPPPDVLPLAARTDGVLGGKSFQAAVNTVPAAWIWRGTLHSAQAQLYQFQPLTDGRRIISGIITSTWP